MRYVTPIFLAIALAFAPCERCGPSCECDPCECCPCEVADIVASYVLITNDGGTGSGVAVGPDLILTAAHVAGGLEHSTVRHQSDDGSHLEEWDATVVRTSAKYDLALLRTSRPHGLPVVSLNTTPLVRGEEVWYCGSAKGEYGMLEHSIVNHPYYGSPGGSHYLIVNGNGWFGDSGCGVYVKRNGRFVLAGIMVHLLWGDARAPLGCEPQDAIASFMGE